MIPLDCDKRFMILPAQIIRRFVAKATIRTNEACPPVFRHWPWGFPKAWFHAKIVVRRQDTSIV